MWCFGSISDIWWCFGSISDTCQMFVDIYLTSSDGFDLWCQFLTSEVPLDAQNSFGTLWCTYGKYCTHFMSGLGSGMPKSVTLVTQVTVNFWAHVTHGHISPFVRESMPTLRGLPKCKHIPALLRHWVLIRKSLACLMYLTLWVCSLLWVYRWANLPPITCEE